ncbi:hypothetical protein LK09_15655 [Microbacterium mangrovi]|uniref:Uncharacterized protein n=1 Tax=Microbacterium mangrovi TaxID=1348253 RepID=A0A0B2A3N9_9MICO|nr:hypothetical protein [Microbacterium mangrovi]KHK96399.1 hypothetical protein LK09_15655 [Microbacterium mangrovi]
MHVLTGASLAVSGKHINAKRKATKIIHKSVKLAAVVMKLGGLKKAISAVRTHVTQRSKLSKATQAAVEGLAVFGVSVLADLFGIGSCVSLLRGK